MKKIILSYLSTLIILLIYAYVKLPVLRLDFASFYIVIIGFFLIAGFISSLNTSHSLVFMSSFTKKHFIIAGVLTVFVIVIPFVASTPFFHANDYRNLIGTVNESDFTKDLSPVSVEDIRLVDKETAIRLGDKKMGEIPGLGSISKLGEFHIQSVDNELYWVAPLVHRDGIKWITNLEGTTGYIMVSATNPQDVKFIQELDGEPVKIIYQPEAYLHQDLARHVYLNGFVNIGLTDFTFEINDEGQPYWVVTLYEHRIGFSGPDAVGVATVHASTGDVSKYSIEDAPKWIDRIQPESFIDTQIHNWGLYVNGFLNAMIAETDVLLPTPGTSLVYGEDGRAYWYTGITSSGGDESTIGFMLVDTRTKEANLYKQPGATELAAMRSAEGKVQQMNYQATFPVMYNILGQPTYVMSLKDKGGLIKMVAFVSVEDFSLVALGDTKEIAFRTYKELLKSKGNTIQIGNQTSTESLTGTISRINADVQDGMTYYYLILDSAPNLIFTLNSSLSKEIPISREGDKVKLSYDLYENAEIDILEFDNLSLNIR